MLTRLNKIGPTLTAAAARRTGLSWRDLYALRDAGSLIELSRGVFRIADAGATPHLDLLGVAYRAPHGMISLTSALAYWELTDEVPCVVHLAVPRGSTRPTIRYPPTEVHVFDAETFDLGRTKVDVALGDSLAITDRERTIVDMMRFRGRIGTDLAVSALRHYMESDRARPGLLLRIARKLRVEGPVTGALEVLSY